MDYKDFFINNIAYFFDEGYNLIFLNQLVPIFAIGGVLILGVGLIFGLSMVDEVPIAGTITVFTSLVIGIVLIVLSFYFYRATIKENNRITVQEKNKMLESKTFSKAQELLEKYIEQSITNLKQDNKKAE